MSEHSERAALRVQADLRDVDEEGSPALTVSALMEQLGQMPFDARVAIEGCDCVGDAVVVVQEYGGVLIKRDPS